MTEQFALDKTGRQCGAIDLDQRPIAACAAGMDRTCDQFLAGASLAKDQNRGIGGRNQLDVVKHRVQGSAASNDFLDADSPPDLFLKVFVLRPEPRPFRLFRTWRVMSMNMLRE